jgi:UPF0755 protein
VTLHEEFAQFGEETRTSRRARERRRKFRRRRMVAIIVVAAVLLLGGGVFAVFTAKGAFGEVFGSNADYEGSGTGEVVVTIEQGTSARAVANQLVDQEVIQAARPFLKLVEERDFTIQAGTFRMHKQMSSAAALDLLQKGQAANRVTVAEGQTIKQIKPKMVAAGLDADDVDAAIDDKSPRDYGLEIKAPSLEGYLFPATYDVQKDSSATAMVQDMVDRTKGEFNELAINNDDANRLLTLGSLVQVESNEDPATQAKVARVFLNRMGKASETRGLLQSDATVAYIFGARGDLTTTSKERASKNPYNTYVHKGLPPGPIGSPGRSALLAAKRPATGDWQYFVATDPDAGEVKFAKTYKEHQANVKEYQAWLREHNSQSPGAGSGADGSDG